jgi:hypothetical protein
VSPRALGEIVRPRLQSDACVRPLNLTVRPHVEIVRPQRLWQLIAWVAASLGALSVVAVWLVFKVSSCQYMETDPAYSPDGKFYTQLEITLCRDHDKSHSRLVMGAAGKSGKSVLLELGPSVGTINMAWHEGPEFRVEAPEFAITKRYGPYDELPRVVVTSPQAARVP